MAPEDALWVLKVDRVLSAAPVYDILAAKSLRKPEGAGCKLLEVYSEGR